MASKATLTVTVANQYVNELVRTLQQNLDDEHDLVVTEVVKGGSLGQGTAIPGNFDLDLVLYSRDIDPMKVVRSGVSDALNKLKKLLMKYSGANCKMLVKTDFCLTFIFHGEIKVDLLPSPFWETKEEFHAFLGGLSIEDRRKFSCSAAKWEKYFFQKQPSDVKDYIKRAKKWQNQWWPIKTITEGRPKSILISVLMAAAYDRSRYSDAEYVEVEFKKLVRNHRSLRVDLEGYGSRYASPPYILDPANPYNNLYISGISKYVPGSYDGTYGPGDGNWTVFVQNIDTLDLSKGV